MRENQTKERVSGLAVQMDRRHMDEYLLLYSVIEFYLIPFYTEFL